MCSVNLDYSSLEEVRHRLYELAPHLTRYEEMEPANFFKLAEKLMKVYMCVCVHLLLCLYLWELWHGCLEYYKKCVVMRFIKY